MADASNAAKQAEGAVLYDGKNAYVKLTAVEHNGQRGALLYYANPDPRKLHAVSADGLHEFYDAFIIAEELYERDPEALRFLIFYGAYDLYHAGADVAQFAGEPDYAAIEAHLYRGVELDARIKRLWDKVRTVGVYNGACFGGSVEWRLFAQLGVCDSATTVQLSEVQLGILPGWDGILNVMIHSNPSNAQYMASTGNAVAAEEMLRAGLVQTVVDAPPAPDRKLTAPGVWADQWQTHAEAQQARLLDAALRLATSADACPLGSDFQLADAEDYFAEIARRTQDTEYRDLRIHAEEQLLAAGLEPTEAEVKQVGRMVAEELALLGKPLAPRAVNYIQRYVKQFGFKSREALIKRTEELGKLEADLCLDLMRHPHRAIGVAAVLAKSPVERIPVFAEVDYSHEQTSPWEIWDSES